MNNNGFVKIYRSIVNCEFWGKPNAVVLFIYLIMEANLTPSTYKGVKLKRGQILTTVAELSQKTGLSVQQVRTSLKTLKLTNTITNQTSPQNSIITVINFDKYQTLTNPLTNEQQTTNKRLTNEQQTYYIKEREEVKETENKRRGERAAEPPDLPPTKADLISIFGADNVKNYERKVDNWARKKGITALNRMETVAKWLNEDKPAKDKSGQSSFDADELDRTMRAKYKNVKGNENDSK